MTASVGHYQELTPHLCWTAANPEILEYQMRLGQDLSILVVGRTGWHPQVKRLIYGCDQSLRSGHFEQVGSKDNAKEASDENQPGSWIPVQSFALLFDVHMAISYGSDMSN